jgi:hypothetical protein
MAGLSFQAIAELTVADLTIADGVAIIRTPGGATTLRSAPDGRICGPCALVRWLHALDLTAIYPSPGVVTAVIARAAPLTENSPHLCQGRSEVCEQTRSLPVLPSVDQWGPVSRRSEPADAAVPGSSSLDSNGETSRPYARPAITRRPTTGLLHQERQLSAPRMGDKVALMQSARAGSAQQISDSPVFPGHLDLVRSNYSRVDREHLNPQSALYADGLEGRAKALLEHRAE